MTPKYRHDCPHCAYIHSTKSPAYGSGEPEVIDWYVCEGNDPSVVGRYSVEGHQYWSMPASMVPQIVTQQHTQLYDQLGYMVVMAYAALTVHELSKEPA